MAPRTLPGVKWKIILCFFTYVKKYKSVSGKNRVCALLYVLCKSFALQRHSNNNNNNNKL